MSKNIIQLTVSGVVRGYNPKTFLRVRPAGAGTQVILNSGGTNVTITPTEDYSTVLGLANEVGAVTLIPLNSTDAGNPDVALGAAFIRQVDASGTGASVIVTGLSPATTVTQSVADVETAANA